MSTKKPRTYRPPVTISRRDYLQDESDALFRESIYAMVQCVQRLLMCRDAFSREIGLTSSQFAVLMGVAHRQGRDGVTVKALAEHVALATTHVTTEVGRLERAGLLVKAPHATDKRSVLLSLSPEGESAIARVAPLVRTINDLLFRDIGARELTSARKVAQTLVINSEYAMAELRSRSKRRE
jgi:DNA-binding MarR family transcriptional regulator